MTIADLDQHLRRLGAHRIADHLRQLRTPNGSYLLAPTDPIQGPYTGDWGR